jgi:hypothetical protein
MVYDHRLPFSFFEHPAVKAFLQRLRPAYYPPQRYQLNQRLLEQCYKDIKKEVKRYINSQDLLAILFDESNNVISDRVINIAVIIKRGAFYYKNINLNAETISTEFSAELIERKL